MSGMPKVMTILIDRENAKAAAFAGEALRALGPALARARAAGDAAQFERLAVQYRRNLQDQLALDPAAAVDAVSLDFAGPAVPPPAA